MIAADRKSAIASLAALLAAARRGVAFTGAGISTESGIPDFRSPGGLWTKNQPIPFDQFVASQEMRNKAWRRKFALEDKVRAAKPGRVPGRAGRRCAICSTRCSARLPNRPSCWSIRSA